MGPKPAWWVRPTNAVLRPMVGVKFRSASASFDALVLAACRKAGLPSLPDADFVDGIRRVHDAFHDAEHLTPIGRLGVQDELVRRLESRIRLLHLLRQHP